jgi:uncharacterized membrane protein YdbT with pleckstrin-like domain
MNIKHLFKIKSYEHVVILLRRHPLFLLRNIIAFVVLTAVPFGVGFIVIQVVPTLLYGTLTLPLVAVFGSIYYLAIWLFFFSTVMDYYLDIWIITNDRLIAVEQQGLFSRTVSEMDLWLIQDVTSEINGIAATIFGFGSLSVQSAAERARFHFSRAANPSGVRQKILDLADTDRKYHIANVESKKAGL